MSLFMAAVLVCMATACGHTESGSAGTASGTEGTESGTDSGTIQADIPADSVLNFKNDSGFARLQSDMESGDVPVECNVLYDAMGSRPDVTVKDAASIREIYDRLAQVRVGEKSVADVTDSYHHVSFHLRNDSYVSFYFEGEGLFCWGYDNYDVSGGDSLWSYVRQLQDVAMAEEQKDASGGAASAGTAVAKAEDGTGTAGGTSDGNGRDVLDGDNPTANDGADGSGEEAGADSRKGEIGADTVPEQEISGSSQGADGAGQEIVGSDQYADGAGQELSGSGENADGAGQELSESGQDADSAGQEISEGGQNADGAGQELSGSGENEDGAQREDPGSGAQQDAAQDASSGNASGKQDAAQDDPSGADSADASGQGGESMTAMNSAYTEIVRAYAAVLALDKTTFMENYEKGLYRTDAEEAKAGTAAGSSSTADSEGISDNQQDAAAGEPGQAAAEIDGRSGEADGQAGSNESGQAAAQGNDAGSADIAGESSTQAAAAAASEIYINYEMFVEYHAEPDGKDIFYGLRDYNEDGTPELVIACGLPESPVIWAGYTFDGLKAVPLFTGENALAYRKNLFTLSDGSFLIHGSGGATAGEDTIARIVEGASGLEVLEKYAYDAQANGTMDHIGASGTLTDEEFQERYWSKAESASEHVAFLPVREGTEVSAMEEDLAQ